MRWPQPERGVHGVRVLPVNRRQQPSLARVLNGDSVVTRNPHSYVIDFSASIDSVRNSTEAELLVGVALILQALDEARQEDGAGGLDALVRRLGEELNRVGLPADDLRVYETPER
jgi:hypothetical protein